MLLHLNRKHPRPTPAPRVCPALTICIPVEKVLARWEGLIVFNSRKMGRTYKWSAAEVEDVAQETRLKLCLLPAEHREHEAYIRTSIYNCMRDQVRTINRTNDPLTSISADPLEEGQGEHENYLLPPVIEDHETKLHNHQLAARLFARLTAEQKLVVAHFYGLDGGTPRSSPRSISRITGIKEARVESILRAALAKLRAAAEEIERAAA